MNGITSMKRTRQDETTIKKQWSIPTIQEDDTILEVLTHIIDRLAQLQASIDALSVVEVEESESD